MTKSKGGEWCTEESTQEIQSKKKNQDWTFKCREMSDWKTEILKTDRLTKQTELQR
jgi:hypothetical protein